MGYHLYLRKGSIVKLGRVWADKEGNTWAEIIVHQLTSRARKKKGK